MKREDPNFVPPKSANASAFVNNHLKSDKRQRDEDGDGDRATKREKGGDEDEEEMEIDDEDESAPQKHPSSTCRSRGSSIYPCFTPCLSKLRIPLRAFFAPTCLTR